MRGTRAASNEESVALTGLGNSFHIRHFEHDKEPLPNLESVDYVT